MQPRAWTPPRHAPRDSKQTDPVLWIEKACQSPVAHRPCAQSLMNDQDVVGGRITNHLAAIGQRLASEPNCSHANPSASIARIPLASPRLDRAMTHIAIGATASAASPM